MLNIYQKKCFSIVFFYQDFYESGLPSLSDRRVDEAETLESEDEVDEYPGGVCLNA